MPLTSERHVRYAKPHTDMQVAEHLCVANMLGLQRNGACLLTDCLVI